MDHAVVLQSTVQAGLCLNVARKDRTDPILIVHNTSFEETQESITWVEKQKQTFLGQAFEDEPFGVRL